MPPHAPVQASARYGRDAVQYSMLPSQGYPQKFRSACRHVFQRHTYVDDVTQRLFEAYSFRLQLERLRVFVAFCVAFCACACVLNVVFSSSSFSMHNVANVLLVSLFATLLFITHTRYASPRSLTVFSVTVLILCLCLCVISLPVAMFMTSASSERVVTPADGLWQVLMVVFGIYTMLPLQLFIVAPVAVVVCVVHVVTAFLLGAQTQYWTTWRYVSLKIF